MLQTFQQRHTSLSVGALYHTEYEAACEQTPACISRRLRGSLMLEVCERLCQGDDITHTSDVLIPLITLHKSSPATSGLVNRRNHEAHDSVNDIQWVPEPPTQAPCSSSRCMSSKRCLRGTCISKMQPNPQDAESLAESPTSFIICSYQPLIRVLCIRSIKVSVHVTLRITPNTERSARSGFSPP